MQCCLLSYLSTLEQLLVVSSKAITLGLITKSKEVIYRILPTYIYCTVPTVASLDLNVTSITCSSITISWTPVEEKTPVNASAHYSSSVHSGVVAIDQVDEQVDEPAHTLSLSNLVADTMYTITVTVKYNDGTTASSSITANTMPGTLSNKGIKDQ